MTEETVANEKICEQIKKIMLKKPALKDAICNNNQGFFNFFVRNGEIQKVTYQRDFISVEAMSIEAALSLFDEESPAPKEVIPLDIYRTFVYMVANAPSNISHMEYGYLRFRYKLEKVGENWSPNYTFTFDEEIHIKKDDPIFS
jgi:hypothetical protein